MQNHEFIDNLIVSIDDHDMENENESNISSMVIFGSGQNNNYKVTYNPDFEVTNSLIDLDVYVSGYTSLMKINRLLFLAEHCSNLRIDALRLALNYTMETFNTHLYISIHKKITDAYNKLNQLHQTSLSINPSYDSNWVETTNKRAALKLEKLDGDLKSAKSLSIKDCIRRGQEDLADHFFDMGDLTNALKCYSRSRDYCASNKNIINLCLNVIKVSIYLKNWSYVLSYVNKVESTIEMSESSKDDNLVLCKVKCAAGLAELNLKRYKSAAKYFLSSQIENFNSNEIITANNVAIYGSICALATYDRYELQTHVLQSSSFKSFLELEPQIRDILFKFNESKYAVCLKLMDQLKDYLLLDMYLSPHINILYNWIRQRALRQYFNPYKTADLKKMSLSFNTSTNELEEELINLILDGHIQARIDSQKKVLYVKDIEQRSYSFDKSLEMGTEFEKRTKSVLYRSLLMKHQVIVKHQQLQSCLNDQLIK